ncbi:MAG: hypothetical protein DWH82_11590 [Planctomycetota bacterium]|nr:MAG: hypothetical protein DWH82_11590 [Planctomycetota bacterium]
MSCPAKVQSALQKLEWIDSSTLGASRVSTQVWFQVKPGQKFSEESLKGAISKAGSNYQFAGVVKQPQAEAASTAKEPAGS